MKYAWDHIFDAQLKNVHSSEHLIFLVVTFQTIYIRDFLNTKAIFNLHCTNDAYVFFIDGHWTDKWEITVYFLWKNGKTTTRYLKCFTLLTNIRFKNSETLSQTMVLTELVNSCWNQDKELKTHNFVICRSTYSSNCALHWPCDRMTATSA